MELKEIIKNTFNNNEEIIFERYRSSKMILIIISFLFFVNFYFVGAGFYPEIFNESIGYLYFLLLLSFIFYFYFLIKKLLNSNIKVYFNIIIFIILLIIFVGLGLPIIIKGGFNGILDIIKLYS